MVKYFGTDGVRGEANTELTPELAFKLGRFGGHVLKKHDETEGDQTQVLVARDTRRSGVMLENALIAGLLSVGVDVMRLGEMTTPGLAYLIRFQQAAGGIMITASHNPAKDNGIKFIDASGYKLQDDQEAEIEALLNAEDQLERPSAEGLGTVHQYKEGSAKYIQFLTQAIDGDLSGLKVVLDGANGGASDLLARLFADLETDDFEIIGASPDGLNINEGYGSTHPQALADKVVELEADAGVAFDGDGDRCIAVDEKGQIVDGDQMMYIIGQYLHDEAMLKKETVVTTVMSNLGLHKSLDRLGIQTVQTQVGDRHVVAEMNEGGYNFGGEQSGHIVLGDLHTTGDGLLTAIVLLSILKSSDKTLSELAEEVDVYPQTLVNVKVSDKTAVLNHPDIQEKIQQAEDQLEGEGRILVRPSGTEPLVRVMVEAKSQEDCEAYAQSLADTIEGLNL